jgi:hypothetical protein
VRLPWAREPNGDVELDLQPTGHGAAAGQVGPSAPDDSGSVYSIISEPRRNSSVYPIFGEDFDPRDLDAAGNIVGWQWRHFGGTVRVFRHNCALEDAIGSHACSLEALTCV